MDNFQRETRYYVAKIRDVDAALTDPEKQQLQNLLSKVDFHRINSGKTTLECVVVESDWPNYQSTWEGVQQAFEAKQGLILGKKFTNLEAQMANAINNLAIALDGLDDLEHKKIETQRAAAIKLLDDNNMLTDHPDWQHRFIVDINKA